MISKFEEIILEGIKRAIKLSTECKSEDERIRPKVGVVIIKNDEIIQEGHRGELKSGEHAEYTSLVKKKGDLDYNGAILITTLEPCTLRKHRKLTCAEHIVNSGIAHVWIGILDPNKNIRGKGEIYLIDNGILVDHFPAQYMQQVLAINREFWKDMTKTYQRDIMSTGESLEKFPKLEIYFENKEKKMLLLSKNPPIEKFLEQIIEEPIEELINYFERIRKIRKLNFILKNNGLRPATNIDIKIKTTIESEFEFSTELLIEDFTPVSELFSLYRRNIVKKPPNVTIKEVSLNKSDLTTTWVFGYHIDNLKHTHMIHLLPINFLVPDQIKTTEITLNVKITIQEPIIIPDQTLKIILKN